MSVDSEELVEALNEVLPDSYRAGPPDEHQLIPVYNVDGNGPHMDTLAATLTKKVAGFVIMAMNFQKQNHLQEKEELLKGRQGIIDDLRESLK